MDTVDRLKILIDINKMSVRSFAIRCGIPQQTLDGQLKRKRTVSFDTISAVATAFPELSCDWLILGEGSMLKSDQESQRISRLVDTIATLQDTINNKSETIASLNEQIRLLKSQLNSK